MQPVVRALLREFETQVVQGPEQLIALMAQYPPPPPRFTAGLRPSHHHQQQDTTTHVWSVASTQHGSGYTAGLWYVLLYLHGNNRIPTVSKDGLYWVFSSFFSTTFYFSYI